MRSRSQAMSLALLVLGAAVALIVAGRPWLHIGIARTRPLADISLDVSGRTRDGAGFALALVALAGVVAVLATRGQPRRIVGAVLAVVGLLMGWRALTGLGGISSARARSLAITGQTGIGLTPGSAVTQTVHAAWPSVALVAGVVVAAGGSLAAVRGAAWSAMAAKYEAPTPVPSDTSLWNAIDAGEDPTARTEP